MSRLFYDYVTDHIMKCEFHTNEVFFKTEFEFMKIYFDIIKPLT